jgi:hypothetical protein
MERFTVALEDPYFPLEESVVFPFIQEYAIVHTGASFDRR